jgi:hypothetical protein
VSAKKRLRLNVGDVFCIPVDEERVGYGQIVAQWSESGGHFYFAIFDSLYPVDEVPDLESIASSSLVLLALSMDALLFHEHWRVVGHREVDEASIPWPAYKEGVSPPGTFDVVDHTGTRRRRAAEDEIECLPFRKVVAPIRVEKALRALHGKEVWDEAYDALRPVPEGQTSAALLT